MQNLLTNQVNAGNGATKIELFYSHKIAASECLNLRTTLANLSVEITGLFGK